MESHSHLAADDAEVRLAGELADVEASISLVADGAVSSVTLTRLHFGQQLVDHLGGQAERRGVRLDIAFWLEDSVCDVHVARMEGPQPGGGSEA